MKWLDDIDDADDVDGLPGNERPHEEPKTDKEQIDELKQKVKKLEKRVAIRDATIAELQLNLRNLELTSYDGTLVWKITDVARRRADAVSGKEPSIYSPPFYTGRIGYKLCGRIYLNGDGTGRGTHLSIFIVVMRGNFDELLAWPFPLRITYILMDQSNEEHVSEAFKPDPRSSSFQKPKSSMNIATGQPLFITLNELDRRPNSYIKDDNMFVKLMATVNKPQ